MSSLASSTFSQRADDHPRQHPLDRTYAYPAPFSAPVKSSYITSSQSNVASNSSTQHSPAVSSPSAHDTPNSSGSGARSHTHTLSSASSISLPQHTRSSSSATGGGKMLNASYESSFTMQNERKRKSSTDDSSASPSQRPHGTANAHGHAANYSYEEGGKLNVSDAQKTKRIKTARACDSCRRKKIRCNVLDDGKILGDPNNGNGGMTCAHCRQYGFECTFYLPITETRFKKKREREAEEMAAAAAAAAAASRAHMGGPAGILPPLMHHPSRLPMTSILPPYAHGTGMSSAGPLSSSLPLPLHSTSPTGAGLSSASSSFNKTAHLDVPPVRISSTQEWPRRNDAGQDQSSPGSTEYLRKRSEGGVFAPSGTAGNWNGHSARQDQQPADKGTLSPQLSKMAQDDIAPPPNTRVLGPTSIAYIVHSTAFVPGAAIEEHDLKHHQTFEVGASGDGIIKFHPPPTRNPTTAANGSDDAEDYAEESLTRLPESLRGRLAGDVAEKLVNTYFERLGYLYPIVSKSEFLHMSAPPPLMLYAICGVAALSREVPKEVLSSIRATLSGLFRNNDIFSTSNVNNVKALLVMSLHSDVHGATAVQAGSRGWNRVGAAIRMAQDLGMHRDASGRDDLDDDAYFLEQKRRIWGFCVTADRCLSISLGHPLAIDLTDCDVRLPAPHEILRYPTDLPACPGMDRPFAFNTEMLKLSILFGRVMKTIYSPTGLMKTTDEEIVGLLSDIDRWKEGLPEALKFRGAKESLAPAGILHVSYACLVHLFFRVFMRISYNCPQHLTFSLTIERMTELIKVSREAVGWVDLNDFYLDTVQFVSYALVFCATVQYHAWVRRGDPEALATLKKAADCVNRFRRPGEVGAHEDLSMRAKTAEVITLLHKCAMGAYNNSPNSGNLNPTAGVTNRRWTDTVGGIVFKPDQTRPGGGVYVATKHNLMLDDLPQGTMILQETEQGAVPALVRTSHDPNGTGGGWQAIGGVSHDGKATQDASTAANLTHLAGDVWADAEGRPVDRQGSRLLTMIPVPGGDTMIQSFPGGPRMSFSKIAGGIVPPHSAASAAHDSHPSVNGTVQAAGVGSISEAAWLSAMAAQSASHQSTLGQAATGAERTLSGENGGATAAATANGGAPTFNFSDLYTFDGQIAQPAALMQSLQQQQQQNGRQVSPSSTMTASASVPAYGLVSGAGQGHPEANIVGADPLSLDGMPEQLDFNAWDQWFRNTATTVNTNGP